MTPACLVLVNPQHAAHRLPGHPERPERVDAILRAIAGSRLGLTPHAASPAPEELIVRVHDVDYVAMLDRAAQSGGGRLDPDTSLTAGSMTPPPTAGGALVEAVDAVLGGRAYHAFAVVRPPGHHAERAQAMGFCLLNNIAIGVHAARGRGRRRIAVIDFDVHHGNGTQHSFADDEDLLYVSSHQYPYYPGTGGPREQWEHVINLPMASGTGDAPFLRAYEERVTPAIDAFAPDLIMVSAGYDAHRDDPLAGLSLSTEAYRRLAAMILTWARRHCGGRTIWTLEGGYDLRALGESVVACLEVLSELNP
jgi:acetoin utilization deacetylase AcuC-like enzyme